MPEKRGAVGVAELTGGALDTGLRRHDGERSSGGSRGPTALKMKRGTEKEL